MQLKESSTEFQASEPELPASQAPRSGLLVLPLRYYGSLDIPARLRRLLVEIAELEICIRGMFSARYRVDEAALGVSHQILAAICGLVPAYAQT